MFASHALGRGLAPRSGHTKTIIKWYKLHIGLACSSKIRSLAVQPGCAKGRVVELSMETCSRSQICIFNA